jgi:hypothetical protein
VWVTNLQQALDAYWNAHSRREEQAAYHEMLLFGGSDGYAPDGIMRPWIARTLRRLACWVEAER